MKRTAYRISTAKQLIPTASPPPGATTEPTLLVATDATSESLREWLEELQVPPFVCDRLCQPMRSSQVIPYSKGVLIELRYLNSVDPNTLAFVSFLLFENQLIAVDESASSPLLAIVGGGDALEVADTSTSGMLCTMLLQLLRALAEQVQTLRTRVLEMDHALDEAAHLLDSAQLADARNQLLRTIAVSEEQLACVESMDDAYSDYLDFSALRGTRSLIVATASTSERMAGRLEKRLDGMRDRLDGLRQERINQRLGALTIISAVLLPLSLLAGVWGMNFKHMPELSLEFGYPMALTIMGMTAGGLLLYFWRMGWFGQRK